MDKYYKKLSVFLINNENIRQEDAEVYEYAIKIFSQSIINTIVTIAIGLIFGMLKECMCFITVFMVLRKFTGGLHAKKYSNCLLGSIFLIIVSMFMIKTLLKNNLFIAFIFCNIISVLIICCLAPIENENKTLCNKEKNIYKLISIFISNLSLLLGLLLLKKCPIVAYSIGVGIITVALLLFISYSYTKKFLVISINSTYKD